MLMAIASQESLAEAADVLRVTPSALSHRLKEAERRLGVPLYQKHGRRLRPTAAAHILTNAAERIVTDLAQSERLAVGSTEGVRHVVRLSVSVYNSFRWLPEFLAWFRPRHPDIAIEIETDGVMNPYENLTNDLIDLIISPDVVLPGPLEAVPLFGDDLVAVAPPGHAFCGKSFVLAEDFADETYLTYSLVRQSGFEGDRLWTAENTMPRIEVKIGSIDAICELIRAGFGVSILSRWALGAYFEAGSLVAVRAGGQGLDITWKAIIKAAAEENAPERKVARALAHWFEAGP